jgi:hypothetical protein
MGSRFSVVFASNFDPRTKQLGRKPCVLAQRLEDVIEIVPFEYQPLNAMRPVNYDAGMMA